MKELIAGKAASLAILFLFTTFVTSCSKEPLADVPGRTQMAQVPKFNEFSSTNLSGSVTSGTAFYSHSVDWSKRSDGLYALAQAAQDFGPTVYWNAHNARIAGGTLRATLAKVLVGPAGGAMSRFDVPDAPEYMLQYDLMFDPQFDFSVGGKVGFGFQVGKGYTGGGAAADGNGGSARIMWFKSGGRVYLKPYLYHKDQPGTWGDDRGKSFPATGNLEKGKWYTIKMHIRSNIGANTDGHITMSVNGVTLIDQAIRWTTNDVERLIKSISFENFRGGSEAFWQSPTDGDIYFNNVSWTAFK